MATSSQAIKFYRHSHEEEVREKWWGLMTSNLSLSTWTHVAVTWNHLSRTVLIYVDGKQESHNEYSPGKPFYEPTGMPYQIGNDGHWKDHQFYGSVMDLFVFGTALSPSEINKLRGERFSLNYVSLKTNQTHR